MPIFANIHFDQSLLQICVANLHFASKGSRTIADLKYYKTQFQHVCRILASDGLCGRHRSGFGLFVIVSWKDVWCPNRTFARKGSNNLFAWRCEYFWMLSISNMMKCLNGVHNLLFFTPALKKGHISNRYSTIAYDFKCIRYITPIKCHITKPSWICTQSPKWNYSLVKPRMYLCKVLEYYPILR